MLETWMRCDGTSGRFVAQAKIRDKCNREPVATPNDTSPFMKYIEVALRLQRQPRPSASAMYLQWSDVPSNFDMFKAAKVQRMKEWKP